MTKAIDRFTWQYQFLSNFWPAAVMFDGLRYRTVEHAYQAAKTMDAIEREYIRALATPGQAKRAGRKVMPREDWLQVRVGIMENLLRQKFAQTELRAKLAATHPLLLIEGNHWHDTFWGVCNGVGENQLGKLLMKIRAEQMTERKTI